MKSKTTSDQKLANLPSVNEADQYLKEQGLSHGKSVRAQVQEVLEAFRFQIRATDEGQPLPTREAVLETIAGKIRQPHPQQLRPVINATGVVVHTNLGRSVLAPGILAAAQPLVESYTNLEFDLTTGKRGARGGRVPELLAQLSGAEDALVVNNNAAAVLLMLSALAAGGEVIVSRGELVEIGGAFRVPDIMRQSGVTLVEVGTTNRTRISDYEDAITENTVALLKVHRSNFAMSGFVEETSIPELAALAKSKGIAAWHDLGSGNFYRFQQPALQSIPTVDQEIRAGAEVLTLSGDKLMGSVQAGIIVGRAEPLGKMRRHPLYRSLRVDKVRMALLEQSLLHYLNIDSLRSQNLVIDCLERTVEEMEPLAQQLLALLPKKKYESLQWELVQEESLAGGGAVPEVRIPTLCLALERPGEDGAHIAEQLRANDPPVIVRVQEGRALLDFRTLFPTDFPKLAQAIQSLAK